MNKENTNIKPIFNDGKTDLAIVLMSIGLLLFGCSIILVVITIFRSYAPNSKIDGMLIAVMSIGWTMYCFCNGYLRWKGK